MTSNGPTEFSAAEERREKSFLWVIDAVFFLSRPLIFKGRETELESPSELVCAGFDASFSVWSGLAESGVNWGGLVTG